MFRRSTVLPVQLGTVLVLALTLAVPAAIDAEEATFLQGHAWEKPIVDGMAEQDRELRRVAPATLAGQYQRLAARRAGNDEMVRRYYLLGRAHGKNVQDLLKRSGEARTANQRTDLLRQADAARNQALRAYREALAIAPGCYFAYHDMGVLELQRATPNTTQALTHLTQSSRLNPRYPAPLRKLVLIYREQRNYNAMVRVLYQLIPLAPNDVVARVTLAGALAEQGRLRDARKIADELLRYDPKNVTFRTLSADLDFRSGNVDRAQQQFKSLAQANTHNPVPLQGYLRCLDWKRKNNKPVQADDYIWAMNAMLRLERREDVRQKLREQIRSLKAQQAEQSSLNKPRSDGKPPTPADLVRVMTGPNEEGRYKVLSFLNAINQPPPKQLLDGVMSRLSTRAEPSGRCRAIAVEILGRQLGWGWMPIARLVAAQDPDPTVRLAAIDGIARMAELSEIGRAGAVLVLGLLRNDKSRDVAAAARTNLARLGNARLKVDEGADDATHRAAFERWWSGPVGEDLKIVSLRRYAEMKDAFVEDVVGAYLRDSSFYVRQGAYEAFLAVKTLIATTEGAGWYRSKRRAGFTAFAAWMRSLPSAAGNRLTEDNAAELEPALTRWWSARPKA